MIPLIGFGIQTNRPYLIFYEKAYPIIKLGPSINKQYTKNHIPLKEYIILNKISFSIFNNIISVYQRYEDRL